MVHHLIYGLVESFSLFLWLDICHLMSLASLLCIGWYVSRILNGFGGLIVGGDISSIDEFQLEH